MSCLTEFESAVYADGELPARETQEIAQHLETCRACRNLVSAARVESRVLVECFQSTDFIEFELEDEALSATQAQNLGVVRFTAFVLAMSVLLRPVLNFLEEVGVRERTNWFVVAAAYIAPAGIRFVESVLRNASWIALTAILFLAIVLFYRRSMLTNSILSALAFITVFSSSSYGLDIRSSDKPVTVPSGETVDDTLVAFGENITVDGTVMGDLLAFARQVTVRGMVKGNVISFAQHVEIEGTVEGSVFGFAQSLASRGQVAHNIYAFAQTADAARNSRIAENAIVFAAESNIEGTIGKDAYIRAASIRVSAPARINGSLVGRAARPENVHIDPGAVIAGKTDVQGPRPRPSRYATLSFYVWQTIWLAAAFLTGLLLFRIVPALSRLPLATTRDMLASAGVGFIVLVGIPIAAIIAAVTLIGLPLGLIALACWLVAIYFAKIIVAGFLGRSLLEKSDTHASTALLLLAGLVPIFIAINLPYVGGLVNFLLVVLGLGMLVLRAFQTSGWGSVQAA
jgi:hypothetical protein